MRTTVVSWVAAGFMLSAAPAFAGRGGSAGAIHAAVLSGSADVIIAEVERAEKLACLACIDEVRPLVDHDSARVRDVAGWWLGKRGVRSAVITDMSARLGGASQDPVAARNAADVAAAMRDPVFVTPLSAYLARPLDEESGVSVAHAIGEIGHPSGAAALRLAFTSSLPGVRAASVRAVRSLRAPLGQSRVMDGAALVPLLSDADATVRREAALTAGQLADPAALNALAAMATTDAAVSVRRAAVWALGRLQMAEAVPALRAALDDHESTVRSLARAALGGTY